MRGLGSRIKRLEEAPSHRERSERAELMQATMEEARAHPIYGQEFRLAEGEIMALIEEHGGVREALHAAPERYLEAFGRLRDLFFATQEGREPPRRRRR